MDTNALSSLSSMTAYADCTLSENDRVDVDDVCGNDRADVHDACGAARGILLSLLLCVPFWVAVYVLLFKLPP
jgi:hypothetical protein